MVRAAQEEASQEMEVGAAQQEPPEEPEARGAQYEAPEGSLSDEGEEGVASHRSPTS
jgi:hypothetical protein